MSDEAGASTLPETTEETCSPDVAKEIPMPDPLLLVEVLSPSNKADTWGNIWACSTIPSVQEMLVVHSTRIAAHVLTRAADGTWPRTFPTLGSDDVIRLDCIDFTGPVLDAYAGTHLVSAG